MCRCIYGNWVNTFLFLPGQVTLENKLQSYSPGFRPLFVAETSRRSKILVDHNSSAV